MWGMRRCGTLALVTTVVGLIVVATPTVTEANPEFNVFYDARSTSLGGTGLTFVDNGAAVVQNPARLGTVDTVAVSASATPYLLQPRAPFGGPGTEVDGEFTAVPLFFVGGGVRIHDRVVVGGGLYSASGVGATYEDVPELGGEGIDLQVGVLELAAPVSVRVRDDLTVGASVRFAFVAQASDVLAPQPDGSVARMEQDLSGADPVPGVTLAAHYRPADGVSLAAMYRSKMTTSFDGNTTMRTPVGEVEVATSTEWSTPHALQAGGALRLADQRLLAAGELAVTFFQEANDAQQLELALPTGPVTQEVMLDWRTTVQLRLGVEYMVGPEVALRGGYSIGNSATPSTAASPFAPPPGIMHAATTGAGLRLQSVNVDVAGGLIFAGQSVDDTVNGSPGRYGKTSAIAALTVTYRQ